MKLRQTVLAKRMAGRAKELRRLGDCIDSSAEVELKIKQMALTQLEHERGKYAIVAPVTGTVESILHRPGEFVAAGAQIAEIVVPRPNRVIAYITDRQVATVQVGAKATVATRGREGPVLHGRVISLGARIEQVPLRLRFIPTIAQWGRLVTIEVEPPGTSVPGEIYNASFEP
jgi:multidrug resistance efflux pump